MTVNKRAVSQLLDDNSFYGELRAFLENAIDEELLKDECDMDCELIDECAELLLALDEENDKKAVLMSFASSKKVIRLASSDSASGKLGKSFVAAIAAVLAITTILGTNAAIEKTSGINYIAEIGSAIGEKLEEWGILKNFSDDDNSENTEESDVENVLEETTDLTEEGTEEITETTTDKSSEGSDKADETDGNGEDSQPSAENAVVALTLSFSESFKRDYLFGEELKLDGLSITAVYADSSTQAVDIDKCTVSGYNKTREGTQKILVTYKGAGASFDVTVTKTDKKSQRVVTGVDGTPPTKTVYTTDDSVLDLQGIKVRLIYSDGTYSSYMGEKDVVITKNADFSVEGTQSVTVRVAKQADYSFDITVEQAVVDSDIERIEFASDSIPLEFNVGDDIYLSDYYLNVYYKTSSQPKKVYFSENENTISIYNLDTSSDFSSPKTMTIGFKGLFTTVKYIVSYKRHVLKADIEGEFKRLYYKGEPLCYDKGGQAASLLSGLASYNLDLSAQQDRAVCETLLRGSSPKVNITYYENASETVGAASLKYSGYNPNKEGYQVIDIFYKGVYLTSYTVFVYSNTSYVPVGIANYSLIDGKSIVKDSSTNYFLKAEGNAAIGTKHYSCIRYLSRAGTYGKQTAYAELEDGTVYSYEVKNLRGIKNAEITISNSNTIKINLNNLENHSFGNEMMVLTFTDNTIETIPIGNVSKYYAYSYKIGSSSYIRPITSMTQTDGADGYVYFVAKNESYQPTPVTRRAYYYRDK